MTIVTRDQISLNWHPINSMIDLPERGDGMDIYYWLMVTLPDGCVGRWQYLFADREWYDLQLNPHDSYDGIPWNDAKAPIAWATCPIGYYAPALRLDNTLSLVLAEMRQSRAEDAELRESVLEAIRLFNKS